MVAASVSIRNTHGMEMGRACLGAPTLPGDSAGWLQGWPYGQRSCGQVGPQGEYLHRWGRHSAVGEEPRPSVRSTVALLGACSSAAAGLKALLSVSPLNSGSSLAVGVGATVLSSL